MGSKIEYFLSSFQI